MKKRHLFIIFMAVVMVAVLPIAAHPWVRYENGAVTEYKILTPWGLQSQPIPDVIVGPVNRLPGSN